MICLECGKTFVNLAVHLRHKHGIDPMDYRRNHNIMLTQALCDEGLRDHLSSKAKIRLQTDEGIAHINRIQSLCDRQSQIGKKRNLPEVSLVHCHEKNSRKSRCIRDRVLPDLLVDWENGMSIRDVALKHCVSLPALRKWVRNGFLPERSIVYVVADKDGGK